MKRYSYLTLCLLAMTGSVVWAKYDPGVERGADTAPRPPDMATKRVGLGSYWVNAAVAGDDCSGPVLLSRATYREDPCYLQQDIAARTVSAKPVGGRSLVAFNSD